MICCCSLAGTKACETCTNGSGYWVTNTGTAPIRLIEYFDTRADLVEVVRCKDCKHRDVEDGFCEGRGWPMQLVPDDGFCDKGKRRGE